MTNWEMERVATKKERETAQAVEELMTKSGYSGTYAGGSRSKGNGFWLRKDGNSFGYMSCRAIRKMIDIGDAVVNPITPEDADNITMSWIVANVDLEAARAAYEPMPPTNECTPHEFTMPPLGTWRVDPLGEISVLVEVGVEDCAPSEGEWDRALRLKTTGLYIQWQKDGMEPPPLVLIRTFSGLLRVQNRRRWLAAREAGVKTLKCWYSPIHQERCASPKWHIDYISKENK